MSNEEEYWVIKSVCTYREFDKPSPPNFDGEKFFKVLRKEMSQEKKDNFIIFDEFQPSPEDDIDEKKSENESNPSIKPSIESKSKMVSELKNYLGTSSKVLPSIIKNQTNTVKQSPSDISKEVSKKPQLPSSLYKMSPSLNIGKKKLIDATTTNTNNSCKYGISAMNQFSFATKPTTTTTTTTTKTTSTTSLGGRILNASFRRSYSFDKSSYRYPTFIQLDVPNRPVRSTSAKATKSSTNQVPDKPKYERIQVKRSASIGPDSKPSFLGSRIRGPSFVKPTNVVTEIKNAYKISNDRIRNVVERLTRKKNTT